jgi:hypothetical protein
MILMSISSASYYGTHNVSPQEFVPMPDLKVSNADVTLLSISSTIGYTDIVEDPWFRATRTSNWELTNSHLNYILPYSPPATAISYYPDRINSILGCIEQYDFCTSTECSGLQGLYAHYTSSYLNLNMSSKQKATFNLTWAALRGVTLQWGTFFLRDQMLLAQEKILDAEQAILAVLPSNQWELETKNLLSAMLAATQLRIYGFASPPNLPLYTSKGTSSSRAYLTPPGSPEEAQLCSVIRVRDSAYYNFSMVGLLVVLILGTVIITISIVCAFCVERKMKRNDHSRREWVESHFLWLLPRAFDSHGVGPWKSEEEGIPVLEVASLLFSAERLWESEPAHVTPELSPKRSSIIEDEDISTVS